MPYLPLFISPFSCILTSLGYLVINILVFDEEMEKLEKLVRRVAAAGVDALIMQVPFHSALLRSAFPIYSVLRRCDTD